MDDKFLPSSFVLLPQLLDYPLELASGRMELEVVREHFSIYGGGGVDEFFCGVIRVKEGVSSKLNHKFLCWVDDWELFL